MAPGSRICSAGASIWHDWTTGARVKRSLIARALDSD